MVWYNTFPQACVVAYEDVCCSFASYGHIIPEDVCLNFFLLDDVLFQIAPRFAPCGIIAVKLWHLLQLVVFSSSSSPDTCSMLCLVSCITSWTIIIWFEPNFSLNLLCAGVSILLDGKGLIPKLEVLFFYCVQLPGVFYHVILFWAVRNLQWGFW